MDTSKIEAYYQEIATTVDSLIQEEWSKVLLYAEVDSGSSSIYFYYYPLNSSTPVYSMTLEKTNSEFKQLDLYLNRVVYGLWKEFQNQKQPQWTNITFTLDNTGDFNIDYDYTDKRDSDIHEDSLIWKYKYLGLMPDPAKKRDVQIINDYIQKTRKN